MPAVMEVTLRVGVGAPEKMLVPGLDSARQAVALEMTPLKSVTLTTGPLCQMTEPDAGSVTHPVDLVPGPPATAAPPTKFLEPMTVPQTRLLAMVMVARRHRS